MESASLLLWASSFGVVFGWQPMPDGSPSYEYIVQLEPELVATLEAGQSIPITSDIPPEVGPIGRIRIVVGRDELPRQQLVTQFKPVPKTFAGQPRDGIVETQFTTPTSQARGADRYGNANSSSTAILPPGGNTARGATDAFAQSLQRGANQAINQGAQGLRNKVNEILPPKNNQLRDMGRAVQAEARELFGNDRGNPITPPPGAQENSILRTRNQNQPPAGGGIAPPFSSQNRQPATNTTIMPPATTNNPQIRAGRGTGSGRPSLNQPITPNTNSNWSATDSRPQITSNPQPMASVNNPASPRGVFNAPWPPIQRAPIAPPTNSNDGLGNRYGKSNDNLPANPSNDSFDIARQPAPRWSNDTQPGYRTASNDNNNWQDGPRLTPPATADTSWPAAPPTTPTIHEGMLDQPANAPVRTVGAEPVTSPQTGVHKPITTNQQTAGESQTSTSGKPYSDSVFPLLLSWVLLSGSVAGNIYLFWNYFDMRGKYSSLVYDTGRRSGERYREYD